MTIELKYLNGYSDSLKQQVFQVIEKGQLGRLLQERYPNPHNINNDKALYQYTMALKNDYLRNAPSLNRVYYDSKISVIKHALGLHTSISRVQGNKLKAKAEIQIASLFKDAPADFLRMIVVHELAHLREKDHNKAFYQLCQHIEPRYHQLEFDVRLYLTHLDLFGKIN
ncbi:MAG: YgjP-like metallopeptidase domain-containing protein [Plesiomonas sp.]|uniref:M48 metallopeptidase family protein n=1 Tax=Plesiomonas sp. TaxID=2486279 RepID=UPI003F3A1D9A